MCIHMYICIHIYVYIHNNCSAAGEREWSSSRHVRSDGRARVRQQQQWLASDCRQGTRPLAVSTILVKGTHLAVTIINLLIANTAIVVICLLLLSLIRVPQLLSRTS